MPRLPGPSHHLQRPGRWDVGPQVVGPPHHLILQVRRRWTPDRVLGSPHHLFDCGLVTRLHTKRWWGHLGFSLPGMGLGFKALMGYSPHAEGASGVKLREVG